jgi:hypothetical protein
MTQGREPRELPHHHTLLGMAEVSILGQCCGSSSTFFFHLPKRRGFAEYALAFLILAKPCCFHREGESSLPATGITCEHMVNLLSPLLGHDRDQSKGLGRLSG